MPAVISPFEAKLKRLFLRVIAARWVIIAVFALSWIVSLLVYRFKGYDRLEVAAEMA